MTTGRVFKVPVAWTAINTYANMVIMAVNSSGNPATHFGRQMRKERLARGWSLREFSARSGIDIGHASRVENGKQPPTARLAAKCDAVFAERHGWFSEYYAELQTWSEVPAAFKDWAELEEKAGQVRDWWPSIISGLLQTEDYARALLSTYPGVRADVVSSRLGARMERQRRLFARDIMAWFIVDELSLYRLAGSAEVMAGQLRQLGAVARMPNVTMQVLPAIANPGVTSGFVIADESAYAEHSAGGFAYPTGETVSALMRIFDTLRGECYRVSESVALLERTADAWTGGSPVFRVRTAELA
jgi:transcriptional regulator with XRE-family HTH domain